MSSLRAVLRAPGFVLTSVVTLAVGIGAATALFSAAWAVLARPLPYPASERLVAVHAVDANRAPLGASLLDVQDWQAGLESFTALGAYRPRSFALTPGEGIPDGPPTVAQVGMVTGGFFDALGVEPSLGRTFTIEEEQAEARVAIVGHDVWIHELRGAPLHGLTLRLNEVPHDVIGVLPSGFGFPMQARVPQLFVPLSRRDYGSSRSVRSLQVIGRLRDGVGLDAARTELTGWAAALALAHPDTNENVSADVMGLQEFLRGDGRRPLLLLLAATGLLLGVACVNVAGLFLGRFLARLREIAVRMSLGAGRARLGLRFLAESAWICALATAAGLAVARGCLALLPQAVELLGATGNTTLELAGQGIDAATLGVASALALVTTLLFGLVPMLVLSRADPARVLRDDVTGGPVLDRWRDGLIVGQLALSLVLLLSTGLLARSLMAVIGTDPGFRAEGVLQFGIGLPESRYDERALGRFHAELSRRLAEVPGVVSVGAVLPLPLGGRELTTGFAIEGREAPEGRGPRATIAVAAPGYFETLQIPSLEGRLPEWRDDPEHPRVLVVNRAFRDAHFMQGDVLGNRLRLSWGSELNPRGTTWEIVGVVGDTRGLDLERPAVPTIYLPLGQFPPEGASYTLRAGAPGAVSSAALQEVVQRLDPGLQRVHPAPLGDVVRAVTGDRRLGLALAGLFTLAAVLVTAVGLHGTVALRATERRKEMAIRAALGAAPLQIGARVVGHATRLAAAGCALGLVLFAPASHVVRDGLYEVHPSDPGTLAVVTAFVFGLAFAAAVRPACRAADPANLEALKQR